MLLVVTLGGSACGSSGGSKAAKDACIQRAQNAAAARVVAAAYAAGQLGSRRSVQAKFPRDKIFGPNGRMLAYTALTPDARAHFDDWMNGDSRVRNVTGDQQAAARRAAADRAAASCA